MHDTTTPTLRDRIGHVLQGPVPRLLLPVPTTAQVPEVRCWLRGQGDPVVWTYRNANRYGDLVLLDLRGHALVGLQVRELSLWARVVKPRGIRVLIVGRDGSCAAQLLTRHEQSGDPDIVWCS